MASGLLLNGGERVWSDGRLLRTTGAAAAPATKKEQVKEVHATEHDQYHADLDGQCFHRFLRGSDDVPEFQGHADVPEVDQVEADDEQVIDRIGEGFVAVEDVNQKHAAVFVEGAGDPNRQGDTN